LRAFKAHCWTGGAIPFGAIKAPDFPSNNELSQAFRNPIGKRVTVGLMSTLATPFARKANRFISMAVATTLFISRASAADICIEFEAGGTAVTNESQAVLTSFVKQIADHPTLGGDQFQIEVYYADDLAWPGIELASERSRSLVRELLSRNGDSPTPWIQVLLRAHDSAEFAPTHCQSAIICTRGDAACGAS
jgi:hypothetical protein